MRYLITLLIYVFSMVCGCSVANAYTLTFDDVQSGTILANSTVYRDCGANFLAGFQTASHLGAVWGAPKSGENVLIWIGDQYHQLARVKFGLFTTDFVQPYNVSSVSGYYSTNMDAVVRVTAYHWIAPSTLIQVASVVIGGPGQSWNNSYVQINSSGTPFDSLYFESISSSGLGGFCVDNMTVNLVPEPSSLLTLLAGLGGFGVMLRRRHK